MTVQRSGSKIYEKRRGKRRKLKKGSLPKSTLKERRFELTISEQQLRACPPPPHVQWFDVRNAETLLEALQQPWDLDREGARARERTPNIEKMESKGVGENIRWDEEDECGLFNFFFNLREKNKCFFLWIVFFFSWMHRALTNLFQKDKNSNFNSRKWKKCDKLIHPITFVCYR